MKSLERRRRDFWRTEAVMRNLLLISMFWAVWMPSIATVGGLRLRANQLVLVLAVGYLMLYRKRNWRFWPKYTAPLLFAWFAFLFWTVLNVVSDSLTLHADLNPYSSIGRVFLIGSNFFVYGATYLFVVRRNDPRPVIDLLAIVGAAMAVFGMLVLVAAGRGWPLPREFVSTGDEPVVRSGVVVAEEVTRLYGGPNKATFLAGIAVICLVLAADTHTEKRWKYVICGSACALGVFLGIARGAVLAMLVGCAVVALTLIARGALMKVLRVAVIGVLVVSLGWGLLMIMPNRGGQITAAFLTRAGQMTQLAEYHEGTAGERLDLWTLLLNDVRKNPFRGFGVDAYQKYYPDKTYTTENFFIEVLHATGVWGFVPLIGVIIVITWRAWRVSLDRATDLQERSITLGMLAGYVAVLAGSLTNSLWGGGLFWAMLGVLAGTVDIVALHTRALRQERLMEERRPRLSEGFAT